MEPQQNHQPIRENSSRRPYQKPRIEKVRLVLEEAVLGTGCKSDGTQGPHNGSCVVDYTTCLLEGT
jgi:hypothetical protein